VVGGYIIYEVVEGWVAGVEGGEGDAVGCEVIVAFILLNIYEIEIMEFCHSMLHNEK